MWAGGKREWERMMWDGGWIGGNRLNMGFLGYFMVFGVDSVKLMLKYGS